MLQILEEVPKGERLLLHSCCGPCSTAVLEVLCPHFAVTLLYYDPNIQPEAEYALRLENQLRVLRELHPEVALLPCEYDGAAFKRLLCLLWTVLLHWLHCLFWCFQ